MTDRGSVVTLAVKAPPSDSCITKKDTKDWSVNDSIKNNKSTNKKRSNPFKDKIQSDHWHDNSEAIFEENNGSIYEDNLKKKDRKLKKITNCPHVELKHYAKGMCNHCYHRYGRKGYSTQCPHTTKPAYAKGLCSNCYFTNYN
jgi:hypothetical protein